MSYNPYMDMLGLSDGGSNATAITPAKKPVTYSGNPYMDMLGLSDNEGAPAPDYTTATATTATTPELATDATSEPATPEWNMGVSDWKEAGIPSSTQAIIPDAAASGNLAPWEAAPEEPLPELPPAPHYSARTPTERFFAPMTAADEYVKDLSQDDYKNVLTVGRHLADSERLAADKKDFYRALSKEERLALDHYKKLPKNFVTETLAAFGTGVGRTIPGSHIVAPQTAAEIKQTEDNPWASTIGGIAGNVAGAITGGGAVAKGITSIPKVGAAIAKSPLARTAITRTVTSGGMAAGQSVGRDEFKETIEHTLQGAGGGLVSVIPEVLLPANSWQLLGQPAFDLAYDYFTAPDRSESDDKVLGRSKDWWRNEFMALGVSAGFAIRDVASGQKFVAEQGAQRQELKNIKGKLRGWLHGKKGHEFELVPPEAETVTEPVRNGRNPQTAGGRIDENAPDVPRVPPEAEIESTRVLEGETGKAEIEDAETVRVPQQETLPAVVEPNEKRARFDALPSPEVSSEAVREIPGGEGGYVGRVVKWLQSKGVIGQYKNDETGWDNIAVNRSSVKNVVHHDAGVGKVALLEAAPNLIKNGIYLETNPKNEFDLVSHIFAGRATIDGTPYAVSFVVREDKNGRRYYDHSLTKVETLDRIDSQTSGEIIADGKSTGTPRLTGPAAKPAGEESTVNILKNHLGVNSKPKKSKKNVESAPLTHSPDAVKYNKRTAKMFIIRGSNTFMAASDIDGQKYITNGHIVKPATDAEIKSLSEALGAEPKLSNPVYEDSKPPRNNSLLSGLLESIKGTTEELGNPKSGTLRQGRESMDVLAFDSPKGRIVLDKKYADLFNQQGNRFYVGGKYARAKATVVVKSADGRFAGLIFPLDPDDRLINNIDVNSFQPLPNYFSHGGKLDKGNAKPTPKPEPKPKGRKPKGEKIDPDDIDWGSPGRNQNRERVTTVTYKNRKFSARQAKSYTDPYRVYEIKGREEKFLFEALTESDVDAELVKHLGETREETREIPRHNNKVDDIDLGYEDAMATVQRAGFDHAGHDYSKGKYSETAKSGTDYGNMEKTVKEFQESTDDNLVNFAQNINGGRLKDPSTQNYLLGKVSDRAVTDIDNLTGIDIAGFKHNVNGNAIEHIDIRHGANGEADHSMADINDVGRIKYVLDNYDEVHLLHDKKGNVELDYKYRDSKNNPSPKIIYKKRVNGNFYVVEAVPDAASKSLQIVSAYKEKARGGQEPDVVQSPQANVRDDLAATPDNKISDSGEKVNRESEKSEKKYTDPAPISPKEFKKLLDRLGRTGLAKDVITDADEMRKRLSRTFGEGAADRFMSVWHGSPHAFDKFSTAYMGSGEGNQSYGWGLYFTDLRAIAEGYAENNGKPVVIIDGNVSDRSNINTFKGLLEYTASRNGVFDINELRNRLIDERNDISNIIDRDVYGFSNILPTYYRNELELYERALELLDAGRVTIEAPSDNLYNVKIHGDKTIDDLNFIRWDKPLTNKNKTDIMNMAEKEGEDYVRGGATSKEIYQIGVDFRRGGRFLESGERVYIYLEQALGSQKAASEFLLRAGIDGIQYPTGYLSKGTHEDSYNYVVFDDKALEIVEHIRLMSTPDGEVYGFATKDGKIYLDPAKMNANTPIHEYGHLWIDFVKKHNRPLYDKLITVARRSDFYKGIADEPNYAHLTAETRAEEALARAIGNSGEGMFHGEGARDGFVGYLRDLWRWVAERLGLTGRGGLSRMDAEDVGNLTLAELAEGGARELLGGRRIGERGEAGENYIREMEKTVREYQESTDNNLVELAQKIKDRKVEKPSDVNYNAGTVSSRAATDIYNLVGINVSGFSHNISGIAIRHIERRHGVNGVADHSMTDLNDVGRIKYVLDNYDEINVSLGKDGDIRRNTQYNDSNNKPSPTIVYKKRVNGNFYVVEAVPDTKAKMLQLVSAYKNKGGYVSDGTHSTPATNVQNVHTRTNKITDSPENVNSKDKKNKQTSASDASKGDYADGARPDADGETSGLRPVELPETVELINELLGKGHLKIMKDLKDSASGLAIRDKDGNWTDIHLAADLPTDPAQMLKTLAHEAGHIMSKFGGSGKYKAVAQKIKNATDTLKQFIEDDPDAVNLTAKDRKRIRREVENLLKKGDKYVDEKITKETPYAPEDILAVWNSADRSKISVELEDYIKGLNGAEKKSIVLAAMKGEVPPEVPTRKEVAYYTTTEAIARDYREAILKEADARRLTELKTIYDELYALSEKWRPFEAGKDPKQDEYRQRGEEVFADAISVYLNDPDLLMQEAPNFWRVFNGWEKAPVQKTETQQKFADAPTTEVKDSRIKNIQKGDGFIANVIKYLDRKKILGEYKNEDKGWTVIYNRKNVRNVLRHFPSDQNTALTEIVPDLIKNGIYLETTQKNIRGLESHIFAAKVNIDGEEKVVGFVVREDVNGKRYYVHEIIDMEAGSGRNSGLVGTTPPKGGANNTSSEPPEYPSIRNIVKKHLGVKPLDENNYAWNPFREVYKEIQELYGRGDAIYERRLANDLRGMDKEEAQRKDADTEKEKERKAKSSFKLSFEKIKEYFLNRQNNLSYIERHLGKLGIKVTDEESAYWAESDHAYNKARILAYSIDVDKKVGAALGGWASKGWNSVDMGDGTTGNLTAAKTFGEFLALNRQATERAEIFNKYSKKDALKELDYLRRKIGEDNWERLLKAKEIFNELRRTQFFPVIKESGAFSKAVIEKMENNEDYATFRVVFENDNRESGAPSVAPVGIRAQKGNLLDIGNAFTATVSNDMYLLDFVSRNNYRLKAFKILEQGAANGMKFKIEKAKTDSKGSIKDAGSGHKLETIYAQENGKTVAYNMDRELATMIREQTPTTHAFWNLLRGFNSLWKPLVTTFSPYFQTPNIIRDNMGTAFNNKRLAGFRYLKNWFASLPEAWRFHDKEIMSDVYREMLKEGAINTGYTYSARGEMGVEDIERRIEAAFKPEDRAAERRLLSKIWNGISDACGAAMHTMESASGTIEHATKLAGYKTIRAKGLEKTPQMAARRVRKYVGTPDALAGGSLTKYMNQIVPFSNIVLQGNLAALRAIQKHPWRSIGLMGTFGFLSNVPAILSKYNLFAPLLTSWFGMDREEAERVQDTYNDTVKYLKKKYIIFPTGAVGKDDQKYAGSLPIDPATTYVKGVLYDIMDQGMELWLSKTDPEGWESAEYIPRGMTVKKPVTSLKYSSFAKSLSDLNPYADDALSPVIQIASAWLTYVKGDMQDRPIDLYRKTPIIPRKADEAGGAHGLPYMGLYTAQKMGGFISEAAQDVVAVAYGESDRKGNIAKRTMKDKTWADWVTETPIISPIARRFFRKVRGGYAEMDREAKREINRRKKETKLENQDKNK